MTANEPVTLSKISSAAGGEGLPSTIDLGMRAISVPINDTSGVSGLIQPRSHVDVLFTKPGSDKFHGQTSFNFSDDTLNARNPYAANKPPFQSRQYGGNLSGPLGKRASFFLDVERPLDAHPEMLFVVLKGPRRGSPLTADGLDEIVRGARGRAGLAHATCHELRHTCLTRLREAGMALEAVQAQAGHRSIELLNRELQAKVDQVAEQQRRILVLQTQLRQSSAEPARRR